MLVKFSTTDYLDLNISRFCAYTVIAIQLISLQCTGFPYTKQGGGIQCKRSVQHLGLRRKLTLAAAVSQTIPKNSFTLNQYSYTRYS